MINYTQNQSEENNKQTLNIAGQEISLILNVDTSYAVLREKFNLLYEYCIQQLGLTAEHPERKTKYRDTMNHYLRNGAVYFLRPGTEEISEEINRNYQLFWSVIFHIGQLSEDKKLNFLEAMKHHHDTDITVPTPNPIVVMDTILSSILTTK